MSKLHAAPVADVAEEVLNGESEIFTVKARRCKRCGGLLTSKQAVEEGYGHVCKMKTLEEESTAKPDPNQLTFFNLMEE